MAEPLKTHLRAPDGNSTMCGVYPKHSPVTSDLTRVDCRRCFGAYSINVDWYWRKQGVPTPPSARWSLTDIPIPGMFVLAYHPNARRSILV